MSAKAKKTGAKKATKADLEAKIAELEAKLSTLSAQVAKPTPPPPKKASPPPEPQAEVALSYSTSSTKYTGNKYYATKQRLAYHPPDKQFTGGQVAQTVQVSPPSKPAPEHKVESQPEPKKEKRRRIEVPAPQVKYYTGDNYYRTRQRLAYHPADKQFIETKAVKFDEPPTTAQVEEATSSHAESKQAKDKKSKTAKLAEYEREYLERIKQYKAEAAKAQPATAKQRGTMPSGFK